MKNYLKSTWLFFFLAMPFFGNAQSSGDEFFGMNYWEYADWGGGITDQFERWMPETRTWGFGIVRIGGNHSNHESHAQVKEWYDRPIQNIIDMGGIPLVQIPINLDPNEVSVWMDYFNQTKGYNIVYWAIGNEPDPSSGFATWYTDGSVNDLGNTYTQFRGKFRAIATEIKKKDPNSIICGPDFRHWWGDVNSATTPFGGYYKNFLYGAGSYSVGTDDYNGDQLVDIFAFHFYGDGGSGDFDEGELAAKYAEMQKLIDATNALRPSNQPIKVAIGEYNDNFNYSSEPFRIGQRLATMAKVSMENEAVFLTPWSICEGNGWSMINKTTEQFYSTAHHWKMLCQNRHNNYMASQINNSYDYDFVGFGTADNEGYMVLLMNEGNTTRTASVKFSTSSGDYSSEGGTVKFRFNANENVDFGNITLTAKSSVLYTFDSNGNLLKTITYKNGDAAPSVEEHEIEVVNAYFTNITNGASFEEGVSLTPNVAATPVSSVVNVQLFVNGVLVRQENISPYDWGANDDAVTNMTSGNYELKAVVTTTSNTTVEAIVNITVNGQEPNNDPLTEAYFHLVNKYTNDYMRPTGGSNTASITQYEEGGEPTYSSFEWEFIPAPIDGYYFIVNKYTGLGIRPTGGSVAENAIMEQLDIVSTADWVSMHWAIEPSNEAGYYWIKNRKSNLYIRPLNATNGTGVEIVQNALNTGYSSFKWDAVNKGDKNARLNNVIKGSESVNINIYPNPAINIVNLSKAVHWELMDVSGADVQSGNSKSIDVSKLKSGLYFLKAQGEIFKVVIQK